jgi:cytochrome c553
MRRFIAGGAVLGAALMLAYPPPQASADASAASVPAPVQACAACHGAHGVSTIPGTPSLAGEPDLYVEWQLVYFRGETRKNAAMQQFARTLSDDDIRDLGAYYTTLSGAVPPSADKDPAATEAGAKLAADRHCAQCHMTTFTGQGEVPRLAGQHEEVLVKALHDYQHGLRRGRGNVIMPEIAYSLNEDDIHNLAHFMSMQSGS